MAIIESYENKIYKNNIGCTKHIRQIVNHQKVEDVFKHTLQMSLTLCFVAVVQTCLCKVFLSQYVQKKAKIRICIYIHTQTYKNSNVCTLSSFLLSLEVQFYLNIFQHKIFRRLNNSYFFSFYAHISTQWHAKTVKQSRVCATDLS